ncbi:hypothetical protein WR25_20479 [Diploscapter pachys]|uniref:Nematode cuticle collagen N-terminal domain-containing protein n=1 Tax=Diploscapter pachys TaxID=2018661 RepID=A0A2A2JRR7_9BILA|nr:hypothetical protein WR25_20479 [Diploscapter pachys]
MSARVLVAGATGLAGVAILVCIGCIAYLFNDVNNTFDRVMDEMKEFKHYSNNAWGQMTDITVFGKNSIFGRVKRGGGGCACGAQAAACPPGPPGPPVLLASKDFPVNLATGVKAEPPLLTTEEMAEVASTVQQGKFYIYYPRCPK